VTDTTDTTDTTDGTPAEPEPSGKGAGDMFADVVKRQSPAVLIGAVVLVFVVGLAAGAAIGWKFEQNRAKDDIARIRENLGGSSSGSNGSGQSSPSGQAAAQRMIGTVTGTSDDSVTVTLAGGAEQELAIDDETRIETTTDASADALEEGVVVAWTNEQGSNDQAAEVIVLPTGAKLGVTLKEVTDTTMTYGSPNGDVTVTTTGATFRQAETADRDAITEGARVIAQTRAEGDGRRALQIVVVPEDSAFV
jgi:hypothetical protein